jgi:hypothetical protein
VRGRRCLVVGSYPPVPGAAAAATVAAVQRAWATGAEVVVASPRPSAAPYVLTRYGPALGRELAALRRCLGCDEVVLCLEPGWPLTAAGAGPMGRTARALAGALLGAVRTELVITGPPSAWVPALPALATLAPAVTVVTAGSEGLAAALVAALPVTGPPVRALPATRPREPAPPATDPSGRPPAASGPGVPTLPPGPGPAGATVGPLEPGELSLATRSRRLAGRAARGLLGPSEPAVHAYVARLVRPVILLVRRA